VLIADAPADGRIVEVLRADRERSKVQQEKRGQAKEDRDEM